MRSDWDDAYRSKPDLQKRYPNITVNEWRFLLSLVLDRRKAIQFVAPHHDALDELVTKLEKRIGEEKG